jgi:FkbM family methyltransferase
VSARLVAHCRVIDRVIAFEPNAESYAHLALNMGRLPIPAQAIAAAVADFDGRGELQHPGHDPHSSHATFLVRNDAGSIPVRQVDSLDLGSGTDLILKIDVEGGELAVVRGARRTLQTARGFVVGFEAHPAHQARTGVDGVEVMRLLQGIRPCSFRVAERPDVRLSLDRPFFEQVVPEQICNVVCATTP